MGIAKFKRRNWPDKGTKMLYLLTTRIVNGKGKEIIEDSETVTMKSAFIGALLSDYSENGQPPRGPEKAKRFRIFQKVDKATDVVELTVEEANTIRECAAGYPTIIYGQISAHLDSPPPIPAPPAEPAEAPPSAA